MLTTMVLYKHYPSIDLLVIRPMANISCKFKTRKSLPMNHRGPIEIKGRKIRMKKVCRIEMYILQLFIAGQLTCRERGNLPSRNIKFKRTLYRIYKSINSKTDAPYEVSYSCTVEIQVSIFLLFCPLFGILQNVLLHKSMLNCTL